MTNWEMLFRRFMLGIEAEAGLLLLTFGTGVTLSTDSCNSVWILTVTISAMDRKDRWDRQDKKGQEPSHREGCKGVRRSRGQSATSVCLIIACTVVLVALFPWGRRRWWGRETLRPKTRWGFFSYLQDPFVQPNMSRSRSIGLTKEVPSDSCNRNFDANSVS